MRTGFRVRQVPVACGTRPFKLPEVRKVGQMAFTRSGIPFRQRERVGERDGGSDLVTHHFPFLAITLVRGLDLVNIFLHLSI